MRSMIQLQEHQVNTAGRLNGCWPYWRCLTADSAQLAKESRAILIRRMDHCDTQAAQRVHDLGYQLAHVAPTARKTGAVGEFAK